MQWYLVKIVFRIISGEGKHTPQFDEQLRLISAWNELQAFEKARALGLNEEDSFKNEFDKTVEWKFIDISELQPFAGLVHGTEIYSKICEEDDGSRYCEVVRMKAEQIRDQLERRYLQPI